MNFIITGASGFIGKNFIRSLQKRTNQTLIIISGKQALSYSDKKNKIILVNKKNFLKMNINFKKFYFYHLATNYNPYPADINEFQEVIESNIFFGFEVISHFKRLGGERLYYTRSYSELQSFDNIYSKSKTILHDLIIKMNFKDYKYIFLYDTYGPGDTRKKFLNLAISKIQNKKTIYLNKKNIKIYLTYIDDVINGLKILKSSSSKTNYSLRPKNLISLEQIIFDISKILKIDKFNIVYKKNIDENVLPIKLKTLPNWKINHSFNFNLNKILESRII